MKTHIPTFKKSALAVLSAEATPPTGGPCGVLSAEIIQSEGDEWKQLLPAGKFSARDGRPYDVPGGQWLMDEIAFTFMMTRLKVMNQPVVVDYNHQTVNKDVTGSEAVAAGWLYPDDLMFDAEKGLLVRPKWTSRAAKHIAEKEFLYLSAVFHYDCETGRPYELRMVALTNDPGVTGMAALAALSALPPRTPENSTVTKEMIALLKKLGITVEDGKEPTAEQYTAALSACDVMLADSQKKAELETKVVALSAQVQQNTGGSVDLSKYVPIATYDAVVSQVATLSAQNGTASIEKTIDDARAAGKIVAAEVDYLKQFGAQQGVVALSAMLEKRPAIPALSTQQGSSALPNKETGTAELSAADLAVIAATGITKEDFIKQRTGEAQ